jgi:membrane-bound serine protease (ClpP class)
VSAVEWFTLFMLAGLVLVVLEIFLPGWVAGTAATVCMIAAAITAFPAFGFKGGMMACILLMGAAIAFVVLWIRILPKTRLGKTIILENNMDVPATEPAVAALLGQEGVAVSRLVPGGIARIGNQRVDVLTEGVFVDPGEKIRVVKVHGHAVTVRKVENAG